MEFNFACPRCGHLIPAALHKSGATISCPHCRSVITVPAQSESSPPPPESLPGADDTPKTLGKKVLVFGVGLLSALYLINPGAGFIEFLPDNIPFLGNLDEVSATLILLRCLSYLGVDLRKIIETVKKD